MVVRGPHVDTGKYFLEIRYDPRASSKKADRKTITSEHENYGGAPSFLGCQPMKSWCTAAAAKAAIPHFRAWVDGGRRVLTTAANTARAASSTRAFVLPERNSKRRAIKEMAGTKVNSHGSPRRSSPCHRRPRRRHPRRRHPRRRSRFRRSSRPRRPRRLRPRHRRCPRRRRPLLHSPPLRVCCACRAEPVTRDNDAATA